MSSRNLKRLSLAACAAVLPAVFLAACDETDSASDGPFESGEVSAPFDAYCTVTLLEDAVASDIFDDELFTAKADERYLLAQPLEGTGDGVVASLLYITSRGATDFELELPEGSYDTNCPVDAQAETYVGVFDDTTAFSDAALSADSCTLPQGTVVSASSGYGFVAEGDVYQVTASGLTDLCGYEPLYMPAIEVELGGTNVVPPVAVFIGPA